MSDEARLREQAREALESGRIPGGVQDRTWGGPGVGADCSVCGRPIRTDEIEFAIQFAFDGSWLDKYHVHTRCFAAWEFERVEARAK
jgi:hypothetical protein